MAKKGMSDFDWWKRRVEKLAGAKQEVKQLYDKVQKNIYIKGSWAFKKLLILDYYIDIYTNIAKKRFDNVVYIDLMCGPGFNYIEDLDEVVAGSPLLAQISPRPKKEFDTMIMVDLDQGNCDSLKHISKAQIICADCNSDTVISTIEDAMKPMKSLFLAFVDPEGLAVQWKTMLALFKMPGDFVINYPFSGVGRLVGAYHGSEPPTKYGHEGRINAFFGSEDWKKFPHDPGMSYPLYDYYLTRLLAHREMVVEFPIMGDTGGFQYRILVAAKKTNTGSPWLKPVVKLRDRIESMSSKQLKKLVDIYRGKQSTLDEFF